MVAQSQQNDVQVGPQGNPESIKNRQKSRSGLQGVLLGVPSDPGSANWHQNDDPRPQKWSPRASKMPARWSSQPPSQPAEQQPHVRQSAIGKAILAFARIAFKRHLQRLASKCAVGRPQGVMLGVPRDHHVTQMVLLHAKMCPPKLTNSRLGCQNNHSGKPESKPADVRGPAAEGEALKIICAQL